MSGLVGAMAGLAAMAAAPAAPRPGEPLVSSDDDVRLLTAAELFALAERAAGSGDQRTASRALRALARNPDVRVRSEARFRLAAMSAASGKLTDSALLLRQILDEQPAAQRVRLELARALELLGDEAGARKALREAQAGGLPPTVARLVDRYSAALRARKPYGASLELAFAPDSNINRATHSERLGTVIGDFELDDDARERSGVGLAVRSQAYARLPISEGINLLGRMSASADVFRQSRFNDIFLNVAAGPEIALGSHRVNVEAGLTRRWFGMDPYSTSANLGLAYLLPIGRSSQVRASAGISFIGKVGNRLQDGRSYSLSIGYERALSETSGAGARLDAERQALRDPGYSTRGLQLSTFGYRDVGPTTLFGTLSYGRIQADERLLIYPERRSDTSYRASVGATFRRLGFGGFAPVVRVIWERNRSSIEIYDYKRRRTEFGLARVF